MKDVFFLTNYFTYFNRISFQTHYGLFSNKIAKKNRMLLRNHFEKKKLITTLSHFLFRP